MNETAAIVVTYNRKEMLLSCIRCLTASETPCDILVIDNASTDGTQEAIAPLAESKQVIYTNTGKNLGGAGGFSVGIKFAYSLGYKYLWLMDDDVEVHKDALTALLEADRRLSGNYGFLSGVAYFGRSEELCRMNIQRSGIHGKVSDYSSPEVPVTMATFVSFFLKAETVKRFGLPIEEFFIWADDLEYSRRISRELPCYMVPASRADHMMGSNAKVGIEQESPDRMWRYEYLYRNEYYLYRREGLSGRAYMLARVSLHSMKILLHAKEGKKERLAAVWKSYRAGHSFRPAFHFADE